MIQSIYILFPIIMTTKELLDLLPASYAEFNSTTVYNTTGTEEDLNDYSIEILENGEFEVRQTGNTQILSTIKEVLKWIKK